MGGGASESGLSVRPSVRPANTHPPTLSPSLSFHFVPLQTWSRLSSSVLVRTLRPMPTEGSSQRASERGPQGADCLAHASVYPIGRSLHPVSTLAPLSWRNRPAPRPPAQDEPARHRGPLSFFPTWRRAVRLTRERECVAETAGNAIHLPPPALAPLRPPLSSGRPQLALYDVVNAPGVRSHFLSESPPHKIGRESKREAD
jgi:hypothetical protein